MSGQIQLKSADEQSNGKEHLYERPEWLLVVATIALVYVTARLVSFTKKLWGATVTLASDAKKTSERQADEMQQSLRISRDAASAAQASADAASKTANTMQETAERQLRAYVSVESYALKDQKGELIQGRAGFTIKNRGLTPAHKVRHLARTEVREYPLNAPLPPNEKVSGSVTVLAPGEEQVITMPFPKVTEQQTKDAVDWKIAMYFYGEVIYEDVFGIERHTRFRLFQSGEGIAIQRLANYHEGNEAD